jgi:predicted amidophosphoribosyltransferase
LRLPTETGDAECLSSGIARYCLKRFQELDQILFLFRGESQFQKSIVMIDDVVETGKAAIVIEAALLVAPQA